MSEVNRVDTERLLELVLVFDPDAAEANTDSEIVERDEKTQIPTDQKAVQSKWTIIHLEGLKTKE